MHRRTSLPNGCASRAVYWESATGEPSIHDVNRGLPRRSNGYISKFRRVEIPSPVRRDVTTFVRRRALQHRACRHSTLTYNRLDLEQQKPVTNAVAQSAVNSSDRLAHAVGNVNRFLQSLLPANQTLLVSIVPIFLSREQCVLATMMLLNADNVWIAASVHPFFRTTDTYSNRVEAIKFLRS
jgi:hypothetical protein